MGFAVVLGGMILAGAAAKATCRVSLRRNIKQYVRKFRARPGAKQQSARRVDAIRKDLPAARPYFEVTGRGDAESRDIAP
jgi:hypothetical protein